MADPMPCTYVPRPIHAIQYTWNPNEIEFHDRICHAYQTDEGDFVVDLSRKGKGEIRRVFEDDWILFRLGEDGLLYPFEVMDPDTFEERYMEVRGD